MSNKNDRILNESMTFKLGNKKPDQILDEVAAFKELNVGAEAFVCATNTQDLRVVLSLLEAKSVDYVVISSELADTLGIISMENTGSLGAFYNNQHKLLKPAPPSSPSRSIWTQASLPSLPPSPVRPDIKNQPASKQAACRPQ
jgi:hypothetical protein